MVGVELGRTLFSARSLSEYQAMFALTAQDLTGAVLDCPGGAASFTAEVNAIGGDATALDLAYSSSPAVLAELAVQEAERGNAYTAANAERYIWNHFPDLAAHHSARRSAAGLFARDVLAHPERYVAGALPHLPFADRRFELVVCGHLLFTYTDRLDTAFHTAALLELVRVTSHQVRVFPLLEHTGHRDAQLLDQVLATVREHGITADVREVGYEFQRGGNQMLVLHRGPDRREGPGHRNLTGDLPR